MAACARPRSVSTAAYAVAYLLIALVYVFWPPARVSVPGVVSIARYIDEAGPVWTAAFGMVAVALAATMLLRRYEWLAHSVAAAVIAGYGAAALLSGALSDNVYGSPLAFLAGATVAQHLMLARRYQTVPQGARHAQ